MNTKELSLTADKKNKIENSTKNINPTTLTNTNTELSKNRSNTNTRNLNMISNLKTELSNNSNLFSLLNNTRRSDNDIGNNLYTPNNITTLNNENIISNLLKEIPLNNLNDYYDIESNIFNKRIQKLNLKFYWSSEALLTQKEIQYPYNKLFLILFKEISLYIEEISRLNKQLKQKTKNERYYQDTLTKYKEKERDYLYTKQAIKSIQRENVLLEKTNEKLKNEIEKLSKKIIAKNTFSINKMGKVNNCKSSHNIKANVGRKNIQKGDIFSVYSGTTTTFANENILGQGSVLSFESNKNIKVKKQRVHTPHNYNISPNNSQIFKNSKKKFGNNIELFNEIINEGINRCDEEIKNLTNIEKLLTKIKN